jgi:AAA domain/AAA domain, putative AbiEii toxin, Type IV TA system
MHIQRLRVLNYKSFRDSGFIEFGPGFNVIVGQNNSGKTALLEALGLDMGENKPHRRRDVPADHPVNQQSRFEFDVSFKGSELVDALIRMNPPEFRERVEQEKLDATPSQDAGEWVTCKLVTPRGGPWEPRQEWNTNDPIYLTADGKLALPNDYGYEPQCVQIFRNDNGRHLAQTGHVSASGRIYAFKAERMNIGTFALADESVLEPNAANLPAVLANLFSNKVAKTAEFRTAVSEVLPSIQLVQSPNIGGAYRIRIQNYGSDVDRNDLAHGLEDCGAGVGQVLAILYVAMTMPPSVIIIDEPNSFLHPGAAKKLLQILARYDHQYIISTHSTDIIASVAPTTLHLVQWADGESKVTTLDLEAQDNLRLVLSEVGIGLSDVFATDRVIWVEGKTEEICFPLLVKAKRGNMPIGTSFLGLRNTGDFTSKKIGAERILELYSKLGEANGILPTALAFSLDTEERTEEQRNDLVRRYKGMLHFLPRRCYENYLIDPEAISAVLSSRMGDGKPVTADEVRSWLNEHGHADPTALQTVDGAKLLKDLFNDLSETTVEFQKVRDSTELTKWLLERKTAVLAEVQNYAISLLGMTREATATS